MTSDRSRTRWLPIPPYIILGAVLIFLPIVFFITYQNIKRQQLHTRVLLVEKGEALIRSFEAGTRAGMRGRMWGNRKLQQLLEETAQLTDIVHIIVTDQSGTILNHNDVNQIGERHGDELDFKEIIAISHLRWRIVDSEEGDIFEVYRRFVPMGMPGQHHGGRRMMRRFGGGDPHPMMEFQGPDSEQVIFVGLKMEQLATATHTTMMGSIITGTLLFLAGSAGVVLLFLYQSYRSTRSSLSRIKAFSDNLVDNMPIGLIALDPQQTITVVNETASQILKTPSDTLIRSEIAQSLPENLVLSIQEGIQQERMVGREIECRISDELLLPLEVSISSIRDDDHNLIGHALLFKDLSEIHELRKEVARSQKLASIGRLAAGVAHEIRNPLSSIKGFATYFRERYKGVEKDRQTANIMINEVDRLDRVVSQLLELARPVNIVALPTELGSFLRSSVQLIEQQASEKAINIEFESSEEDVEVFVDQDRINQMLLNLYLNAIDAMEAQGVLKISSWFNPASSTIHISVSDSGKGIAESDLPKIFDPYYTTKPTGTGLGLAIVHNILEAHQGKIKVDSNPGVGTLVTLQIPNLKPEPNNE